MKTFKEGDKVVITSNQGGNNFKIGEIVTITALDEGDNDFKCNNKWWVGRDECELFIQLCDCGKPLIAIFNHLGKKIGVTHLSDDEDFHLNYFSSQNINKRLKEN